MLANFHSFKFYALIKIREVSKTDILTYILTDRPTKTDGFSNRVIYRAIDHAVEQPE